MTLCTALRRHGNEENEGKSEVHVVQTAMLGSLIGIQLYPRHIDNGSILGNSDNAGVHYGWLSNNQELVLYFYGGHWDGHVVSKRTCRC